MQRIRLAGLLLVLGLLLSLGAFAQDAPDKALADKIWAGWQSGNVAGQEQFYSPGAHVFFDVAPLKYSSWDEYKKGATAMLAGFSSAKFHVNDDVQFNKVSNSTYWGTSTVDFELTKKDGNTQKGTMRWTFVMEKQKGKWMVVHEHVSVPMG
jgi:ketosteroid isomerase-like protein